VIDMWEEILKRKASADSRRYYRDVFYNAVSKYITENYESGTLINIPLIRSKLDEIQELCLEVILEERGKMAKGAFLKWYRSKSVIQIPLTLNKMIRLGLMEAGGERSIDSVPSTQGVSAQYTSGSRAGERATTYIMKGWQHGPKPKQLTPEMEEDINEVVADDEFAVSNELSDKIKHILMETPEGKPARTKEDIREFNRRFPGIKTNVEVEDDDIEEMDSGCGCGCDGKEVAKAKSGRCTKRTGKTSSNRKGKKWMACVPAGKKGKYKRVHWGQAGVKVTGKSGNTKRKKSFNARHKCDTCTGSDYSPRCMACKDW